MEPTTANLNSEEFIALLNKLDACLVARNWAQGKDLATAWTTCHRSDWLLWLLDEVAPLDPITNELLICRFAREVVHLNPDPCVLACIEAREAWARGEVSDEVRNAARAAADTGLRNNADTGLRNNAGTGVRDNASTGVWDAAWDAARAAAWENTVNVAWVAARTTGRVAAEADTWATARARQADIIRELVPMPVLA